MDENNGITYNVVDPPNLHIGFTKDELMLYTFLMMSIIAFASVFIMGVNALIHIITALGTVLIAHNLIQIYEKRKGLPLTYESPTSPMVAGMIVALAMPIAAPFVTTAGVALLMIVVFKYGQGKIFKHKYLNPAATAKVVLLVFLSLMVFLEEPLATGLLLHPHHLELNLFTPEGFQASMWIFGPKELPITGIQITAAQGLFFWQTHGWIGGACGILVLIVGTIAAVWLRYKWRIIASALISMILMAMIYGFAVGGDPILRIAFHVFTGSFIFMVFFMASEPQSTPLPEGSQFIFGIALAVITFILQLFNVLGGSIIALVLLNIATPFLDKITLKKPYGLKESTGGL